MLSDTVVDYDAACRSLRAGARQSILAFYNQSQPNQRFQDLLATLDPLEVVCHLSDHLDDGYGPVSDCETYVLGGYAWVLLGSVENAVFNLGAALKLFDDFPEFHPSRGFPYAKDHVQELLQHLNGPSEVSQDRLDAAKALLPSSYAKFETAPQKLQTEVTEGATTTTPTSDNAAKDYNAVPHASKEPATPPRTNNPKPDKGALASVTKRVVNAQPTHAARGKNKRPRSRRGSDDGSRTRAKR